MIKRILLAVLCVVMLFSATALAYQFNDDIEGYGYFQGWFTVYEQMEEASGIIQYPSQDTATGHTTGFSLSRVRLGLNARFLDGLLGASFQLKLEEDIGVLDATLKVTPVEWLSLWFGQFKIPNTAENLRDDRQIDFILRSDLSGALADYSLSRTTYASSLLYGNRSYTRDLGLGIKTEFRPFDIPIRGFFMIGNGLGANLFISGNTQKGVLITNGPQLFYGLRLEVEPFPDWIVLGGHVNYNRHDNAVFNSGRVVMDLDRLSSSADITFSWARVGLSLGGLVGKGAIGDEFNHDGKKDFLYSGFEMHLLWRLKPLLGIFGWEQFNEKHRLSLGLRYEDFQNQSDESGVYSHRRNWTLGLTYEYMKFIRLQFNAVLHRGSKPYEPDLDDDIYLLCLQFSI